MRGTEGKIKGPPGEGLFHYGFSELRSEMRSIELAIIDHFDLCSPIRYDLPLAQVNKQTN